MKILVGIAREQHRAVLIVTHDPRLLPFADRIVHIEDGRIVREERRDVGLQRLSQSATEEE